jgi:hypothetical protein
MAGDVVQVVEHLFSRYKALTSNPSTAKKRTEEVDLGAVIALYRESWALPTTSEAEGQSRFLYARVLIKKRKPC